MVLPDGQVEMVGRLEICMSCQTNNLIF